jgi:L-serine deaminase
VDLAYLDAGSGSLIVQAVVAGAAGMAVAVKLYWRRLKGLFKRQPAAAPDSEPAQAEAQTADRD